MTLRKSYFAGAVSLLALVSGGAVSGALAQTEPADTHCVVTADDNTTTSYTIVSQQNGSARKHQASGGTLVDEANNSAGEDGTVTAETATAGESACAILAGADDSTTLTFTYDGSKSVGLVSASTTDSSAKAIVTGGNIAWGDPTIASAPATGAPVFTVVQAARTGSTATDATVEARYARAAKSATVVVSGAKASQQGTGNEAFFLKGVVATNNGGGEAIGEITNGVFQFGGVTNVTDATTGTNGDSKLHGYYGRVLEVISFNGKASSVIKNSDIDFNRTRFDADTNTIPTTDDYAIYVGSRGTSAASDISLKIDEGLASGGSTIKTYSAKTGAVRLVADSNSSTTVTDLNPVTVTIGSAAASTTASTLIETAGDDSHALHVSRNESNSKNANITITIGNAELKAAGAGSHAILVDKNTATGTGRTRITLNQGSKLSASAVAADASYVIKVENQLAEVYIGGANDGGVTVTGNMSFGSAGDLITIRGGLDDSATPVGVTVTGDIDLGAGRNRMLIGGTLAGTVTAAGGDDIVTIGVGSTVTGATFNLGAGDDVIRDDEQSGDKTLGAVDLGAGDDNIGADTGGTSRQFILGGAVSLGDGSNKVWAKQVTSTGSITGGAGADEIIIYGDVAGAINLGGDTVDNTDPNSPVTTPTNNSLTVVGVLTGDVTSAATGTDTVNIQTGGSGSVNLGGGTNNLTVYRAWTGRYGACTTTGTPPNQTTSCVGGSGADTITLYYGASIAGSISQPLDLGAGDDAVFGAGGVDQTLGQIDFGAGDDIIGFLDPAGPDGIMDNSDDNLTAEDDNPTAQQIAHARLLILGGAIALGDGANTVHATSVSATGSITGGTGADVIDISGNFAGTIDLGDGAGDNTLRIGGNLADGAVIDLGSGTGNITLAVGGQLSVDIASGATGTDTFSVGGGSGKISLGDGVNNLTVTGAWTGNYENCTTNTEDPPVTTCVGGTGVDTVTLRGAASASGTLNLGAGANVVVGAGAGDKTLGAVAFGDGADIIGFLDPGGPDGDTTTPTGNPTPEEIAEARSLILGGAVTLGDGANTVHAKEVGATGSIMGGAGMDVIDISGAVAGAINLGGDTVDNTDQANPVTTPTSNTLTIGGALTADVTSAATGTDTVSIGGGSGNISLGGGANSLTISGAWTGKYGTCASTGTPPVETCVGSAGVDTIIFHEAAASASENLDLGAGDNVVLGSGAGDKTLGAITFGDGADNIGALNPFGPDNDNSTGGDNPTSEEITQARSLIIGGPIVLGGGANMVHVKDVSATGSITGGAGADTVDVSGSVSGTIDLGEADVKNTLKIDGDVTETGSIIGRGGEDMVDVFGNVAGTIDLGDGDVNNTLQIIGHVTEAAQIDLGEGGGLNNLTIGGNITAGAQIDLGSGSGDRNLTVGGELGADIVSAATGTDTVSVRSGTGGVDLGEGTNNLSVTGSWRGNYGANCVDSADVPPITTCEGGGGVDTLEVQSNPTLRGISRGTVALGGGANVIDVHGDLWGRVTAGDDVDTLTLHDGGSTDRISLLDLGNGNNVIVGSGTENDKTLGALTLGGGDDVIGDDGQTPAPGANDLIVVGEVRLGGGFNTVRIKQVRAGGMITGGADRDDIRISDSMLMTVNSDGTVSVGTVDLGGGTGQNTITIGGDFQGKVVSAATGQDTVEILGGSGEIDLGDGSNNLTIKWDEDLNDGTRGWLGMWTGSYGACSTSDDDPPVTTCSGGGSDVDAITVEAGARAGGTFHLGDGNNTVTVQGILSGMVTAGAGNDTVGFHAGGTVSGASLDLGGGQNLIVGVGVGDKTLGDITLTDGDDDIGDHSTTAPEGANDLIIGGNIALGNGTNRVKAKGVTAAGLITGGAGEEMIDISDAVAGVINLGGDTVDNTDPNNPVTTPTDNAVTIGGDFSEERRPRVDDDGNPVLDGDGNQIIDMLGSPKIVSAATGTDTVTIMGGSGDIDLGGGTNLLTIMGVWTGSYGTCADSADNPPVTTCSGGGAGADTITLKAGATAAGIMHLGDGENSLVISEREPNDTNTPDAIFSGEVFGGSGTDTITIAGEATLAEAAISLGEGKDIVLGDPGAGDKTLGAVSLGAGDDEIGDFSQAPQVGASDLVIVGAADLGEGDDRVKAKTVEAAGSISGGAGDDTIVVSGGLMGTVTLGSGAEELNSVTVQGIFGECVTTGAGPEEVTTCSGEISSSATGTDTVSIVNGSGDIDLGGGRNTLTVSGNWTGSYGDCQTTGSETVCVGGEGVDALVLESNGSSAGVVGLGGGENTIDIAGTLTGKVSAGASADILTVQAGADISRGTIDLGGGSNTVIGAGPGDKTLGAIIMGGGEDTIGDHGATPADGANDLVVSGPIDLGGGLNRVVVSGIAAGGSITGGQDRDEIRVINNAEGPINLGGGGSDNVLTLDGNFSGKITSTALGTGTDTVSILDGEADISLGGGVNNLTVYRDWTGNYGECEASGPLQAVACEGGDGNDTIEVDPRGSLSGVFGLGGGTNRINVLGSMTGGVSAGGGQDTLTLQAGEEINLSSIDLGGGANAIYVAGKRGGTGTNMVTLSLSDGPATVAGITDSDSVYLCNEGFDIAAGSCAPDAGNGDYAFSVTLDASNGSTWETVTVLSEQSSLQSIIQAKGDLTLTNSRFGNLRFSANEAAGDIIRVSGTYEMETPDPATGQGGALFQLDISTQGRARSDRLVFGEGASPAGGTSPVTVPVILLSPVSLTSTTPEDSSRLDLLEAHVDSGITGVTVVGVDEGRINVNNNDWELVTETVEDASGETVATLYRLELSSTTEIRGGGDRNFAGGTNTITVTGSWGGNYGDCSEDGGALACRGGAGIDTIIVNARNDLDQDIIASGEKWNLGHGDNVIKGGGAISAEITMGRDNDTVGNFADDAEDSVDNRLKLRGDLNLGGGANMVKVAEFSNITAGDGDDTVILANPGPGNDISLEANVFLGGGMNVLEFESRPSEVTWNGVYGKCEFVGGSQRCGGGAGDDTIIIGGNVTVAATAQIYPGGGSNVIKGAGVVEGSIIFDDGDDSIGADPCGADGDCAAAGDNLSDGEIQAANNLALNAVELGGGENSVWAKSVAGSIAGGSGRDLIHVSGVITGAIHLGGNPAEGTSDNQLAAEAVKAGVISEATGADRVAIGRKKTRRGDTDAASSVGDIRLGGGENALMLFGALAGNYGDCVDTGLTAVCSGGSGPDNITVGALEPELDENGNQVLNDDGTAPEPIKTVGRIEGTVALGGGANTLTVVLGTITQNVEGGGGSDRIRVMAESSLEGDVLALGDGVNTLDAEGTIAGNVTAGQHDDSVTLSGGTISQNLALGGGKNRLVIDGGGAVKGTVKAGSGDDTVILRRRGDSIDRHIDLGDGLNEMDIQGEVKEGFRGGKDKDTVVVQASGILDYGVESVDLGGGANEMEILGKVGNDPGKGRLAAGDGNDTLIARAGSTLNMNVDLGNGNNRLDLFGALHSSRDDQVFGTITLGNGLDTVTIGGEGAGVNAEINLGGGSSDNSLTILAGSDISRARALLRPVTSAATGTDKVSIVGGTGDVNLGGGRNEMTVRGDWSGAYGAGEGDDIFTILRGGSLAGSGDLDLRGGNNSLEIAGTVSRPFISGGGADTVTLKTGGRMQRDVSLGDGLNQVIVEPSGLINGAVTGGRHIDIVTVNDNATVSSLDLGGGKNVLQGSGEVSGAVAFGDDDDIIGSVSVVSDPSTNSLRLGDVALGGGKNIVRAGFAKSISGGDGDDWVSLSDPAALSSSSGTEFTLGGGANRVFIEGGAELGGSARSVNLSRPTRMENGAVADTVENVSLHVCKGAFDASQGGCAKLAGDGNLGFNITLEGSGDNSWKEIIFDNQPSRVQSVLNVKGGLTLKSPVLNNVKVAGDSSAGDKIVVSGRYGLTSDTMFELDIDVGSGGSSLSDELEFTADSARNSGSADHVSAPTIAFNPKSRVTLQPGAAHKVVIAKVMKGSDVTGVRLDRSEDGQVEIGGYVWSLGSDSSNPTFTTYYLTSSALRLTREGTDRMEQHAMSLLDILGNGEARFGGGALDARSRAGGVSQDTFTPDEGTPVWTRVTISNTSEAHPGRTEHRHSSLAIDSGADIAFNESESGVVKHFATAHYGTSESDYAYGSLQSSSTGLGYGLELRGSNGGYTTFAGMFSRNSIETIERIGSSSTANLNGLSMIAEIGRDFSVGESGLVSPMARLSYSGYAGRQSVGAGYIDDLRKISGDIGVAMEYTQGATSLQGRERRWGVGGDLSMSRDFQAGYTSSVNGEVDTKRTWIHFDAGWFVDIDSRTRSFIEFSVGNTVGGEINGKVNSISLGFDANW